MTMAWVTGSQTQGDHSCSQQDPLQATQTAEEVAAREEEVEEAESVYIENVGPDYGTEKSSAQDLEGNQGDHTYGQLSQDNQTSQ